MKALRPILAMLLGTLALSGCFILDDLVTYDLEVVNRCTGGNYTVAFYFDSVYQRDITTSYTFTDIRPGVHVLEALGSTYFRREVNFDSSKRWTLCPYYGLQGSGEQATDAIDDGAVWMDPTEVKP